MSIDRPPNHNLQQTLVPIEHALVASANIIDQWATLHGGDKNPFFEFAWDDEQNNLKIELQSRKPTPNLQCVEYDLYIYDGLNRDQQIKRFKYDSVFKTIDTFDAGDRPSTTKNTYAEKVEELSKYLATAPVGTATKDSQFQAIMEFNNIQDPR